MKVEHKINEQIRDKEIRVISKEGSLIGVMSPQEALKLAETEGVDLVMISPNAVPPVCRIMDYGKFRYELQKKEKEQKKNQKVMETKEIRLQGRNSRNMAIGEHDIQFKAKNAIEFLKDGNKVKLSIFMKGRQVVSPQKGIDIINDFAELLSEFGSKEKETSIDGRSINVIIAPKPGISKK